MSLYTSQGRVINIGMEGGGGGEHWLRNYNIVLFLQIASKRNTFIFDAPEFHIDYFRTPLPPL